jgi:hypothetical protein
MIRHVLLFKWTEESDAASRAGALSALRGLDQTVPGIRQLSVTEGLGLGASTYDCLLEAHFEDESGYRDYVVADTHQEAWRVHPSRSAPNWPASRWPASRWTVAA